MGQIGFALSGLLSFLVISRTGAFTSLIASTASFSFCIFGLSAGSITALFALFMIGAFVSAGLSYNSGMSILRAAYPERFSEIRAYYGSAVAIAPICAPAVAGQLAQLSSWRVVIAGLGGSALLFSAAASIAPLRNEVNQRSRAKNLTDLAGPMRDANFLRLIGQIGILQAGTGSLMVTAPFVLQAAFGLQDRARGLVLASVSVCTFAASLACGRLIKDYGEKLPLIIGMSFLTLSVMLCFPDWVSPMSFISIAVLLTAQASMAFLAPVLIGRSLGIPEIDRDVGISVVLFAQTAGWGLGMLLASGFAGDSLPRMLILFCVLAAAALAILVRTQLGQTDN